MDNATLIKLTAGVLAPLLGLTVTTYHRFRRTGTGEIESFSRYLRQGVKYYVGRWVRRQLAGELTLRQYARIQLRSTATDMIVPATYPVSLKVDDVFVPLLLRDATRATVEYHDLVERASTRIVILGEPGSGKSSLMKRIFRDACRKANADPRHAPMPVLFELRNLSRQGGHDVAALTREHLFEECISSVGEAAAFKAKKAVEDLLHGAGFLILLDGLDEIPRDASAHVAETITELGDYLALTSPKSSLVVSTRTQHYLTLHDRKFSETFQPLQIRAFSVADVYRFLLNWPFESDRASNITRLFSRIRQLPSLTEMCTNPLALSMFVARDQQTEGALSPETRTEFYSSLVDELLVNRRFRREEGAVGRQRLRKTRERILGAVCLGHLLDPEETLNSITEARLLAGISTAGHAEGDAIELLEALAVDTGLFSAEREGETYRFMHLTLCEFLAARAVVNAGEEGWKSIADRLSEPRNNANGDWASRLGEVVAFASGLAPDSLCDIVVQDLTSYGDEGLLLRSAIEAQAYANPAVIAAVHNEADSLAAIEPQSWDVAWFSRLRWLIAVLRDIAAGSRAELGELAATTVPSPTVYLVGLIDAHNAAERLLATLARADADAALTIAEDSGRSELMDVVVGAADDFGVLLGVLARTEAGANTWGHALVHCALRERQIADVLSASREAIGPAPSQGRWEKSFVVRGSVYGRLLDEVLASPDGWREDDHQLLVYLARVKPPHRLAWPMLRGFGVDVVPAVGGTIAALFLINDVFTSNQNSTLILTVTSALAIGAVGLYLLSRGTLRLLESTFERTIRARHVRALRIEVNIGAIALELDSPRRTVGPTTSGRVISAHPRMVPDRISRLWRGYVLEETLNLGRFRFGTSDRPAPSGEAKWVPKTLSCLLAGVGKDEVRALIAARQLREAQSVEAAPSSSPSSRQPSLPEN